MKSFSGIFILTMRLIFYVYHQVGLKKYMVIQNTGVINSFVRCLPIYDIFTKWPDIYELGEK